MVADGMTHSGRRLARSTGATTSMAFEPAPRDIVRGFVETVSIGSANLDSLESWIDELALDAGLTRFKQDEVLVEHHAVAKAIHFMIDGCIRYQHLIAEPRNSETLSSRDMPWMPIGWSSLHFRRYRVTVVAESTGSLLSIPLGAWQELAQKSPPLWVRITEFVLDRTIRMLEISRRVDHPLTAPTAASVLESIEDPDTSLLNGLLAQSSIFGTLPAACRRWLAERTLLYRAEAGETILGMGQPTRGLWLLQNGRISLSFSFASAESRRDHVTYAVRPGTLVGLATSRPATGAQNEVVSTRRSTLAHIPSEVLAELMEFRPDWAGSLYERILWQVRKDLVSTRARFSDIEPDGGVASLVELIEDGKPILPVTSGLFGVPAMLRSKLTREQGFEQLYKARLRGTEGEKEVAGIALDLLRDFERGHRFYRAMLSTYSAVVSNRQLDEASLRRVSTEFFRDALTHVPYVIAGLENLPDDPNCIFIYNHMAYADDSVLPNGFLFNPDSHFLSSMIMEPKYGDGIRIARTNAPTEFWRADYYEQQGHIEVVTPESGWIDETAEEKERRKDRFFADCQAMLARGLPFSIAPEGTITEEDSVTERSPGPLRPGAFLMSWRFPSQPKIVPVAFAHLDKPAWKAVFACVIKPPFSLEERGVDGDDRANLSAFLEEYRREFRGHVEEAVALAGRAQKTGSDIKGLITNLGQVDAVHEEFELDVRDLELQFPAPIPDRAAVVFYGSSTIQRWESLQEDVANSNALNLGIGGSTLHACRMYLERLVLPHRPGKLVIYCGENDIERGESAAQVAESFVALTKRIETLLPQTDCWFVSIKPSPGRLEKTPVIDEANRRIRSQIDRFDRWQYVDWCSELLLADGQPEARLFCSDGVHVNADGYKILGGLLRRSVAGRAGVAYGI